MNYKNNWKDTREKFINWWEHRNTGRPLMIVVAKKNEFVPLDMKYEYTTVEDKYINPTKMVGHFRNWAQNVEWLGESFPNMSADFGPGSLAAYLGCDIEWQRKTVWFKEFIKDVYTFENMSPFKFDPNNKWFSKHIEVIQECAKLANGEFLINIPDIMENIDVYASIRGAQNAIFDLMDEPEIVKDRINQIQNCYFDYYDRFYEVVKMPDSSSSYTMFSIWGPGKVAKLQCDFSAMLSPQQFRDFIQESLRQQAKKLDYVLYHLDGPEAIRHVDALMEIDEIDALQWTSGDHGPDGTQTKWFDSIYDKVIAAGKSLWIKVYSGTVDDWIEGIDRIVKRYGSKQLLFYFNPMSMSDAQKLLTYAENHWADVKGSFES